MDTSTMERGSDETPRRDRPTWRVLGIGALAGLVAGLVRTLVQVLARLWVGVAPLLPVQQFLGFFGGFALCAEHPADATAAGAFPS